MKRLKNKKNALIHHSIKRAKQRYDLDLNEHQIREISNFISKQKKENCIFLSSQTNRVKRWAVKYNGKILPVIYDNQRHIIVTILEENMLTNEEKQLISIFKNNAEE